MKKLLLISILCLVIISALFESCSFGNKSKNSSDSLYEELAKDYPIVDIEDARKIEHGMTYNQVVSIIGHGQYFTWQNALYPVLYCWKTPDGNILMICFAIDDSLDDDIILKYGGWKSLAPENKEDEEEAQTEDTVKPIFTVYNAILFDHGEIVETICSADTDSIVQK